MNWTRSRDCSNGACVEVRATADGVEVRDSKLGDTSPVLAYTTADWVTNVVGELQGGGWLPEHAYRDGHGNTILRRAIGGTELVFTETEWDTFVAAVRDGDFDIQMLAGAR